MNGGETFGVAGEGSDGETFGVAGEGSDWDTFEAAHEEVFEGSDGEALPDSDCEGKSLGWGESDSGEEWFEETGENELIVEAAADGDVSGFFGALYRRNFCKCLAKDYSAEVTLSEVLDVLAAAPECSGHEVIRTQMERLSDWMHPIWSQPALCYWQGVNKALPDDQYEEQVEEAFHRYRDFASR